jgi:glycerophosphoryl diester phosphodiesterase
LVSSETGEFAGEQIPTLKEAMDVIQNSSFTLIERKEGKAKDLVRFLKKERWLHEVVVQSFDWDFIKELSEYSNALSLGTLGPPWGKYNGRELTDQDRWLNADFIDDIVSRGAQYIAWNNWVTQESVAFAHEKDLRVLIYTIDDPKEALRLVALGVDGIITNDPETMAKILR